MTSVVKLHKDDFSDAMEFAGSGWLSEQHVTNDLVRVLRPHWQGLERRLVVGAMRARYRSIGRDVPVTLGDDVDRIFERSCSDSSKLGRRSSTAIFCCRRERAGEIWTLNVEQADAWLDGHGL